MTDYVYKLLQTYEWEVFEETGVFLGTPLDFQDGYIHLSTAQQVVSTARLHFKDKGPLVLAEFAASDFGAQLKYEPARDGSLFPHQFGILRRSQVKQFWHLKDAPAGSYEFPKAFS